MCVKVFLADDAEIMRKAIRSLLSKREDIAVVGEASNFRETIQKTAELHPDLIVLDAHLADENRIAPTEVKSLLNGAKVSGSVRSYDKYSIVLETNTQAQLIFKHSVSALLVCCKNKECTERCQSASPAPKSMG